MDFFASDDPDFITKQINFVPTYHRQIYPAIAPKDPRNSAAGKTVLITGATRGIGKGIALTWAEAGARGIVITGRAKDRLDEVAAEIQRISPDTKVVAVTGLALSQADTTAIWNKAKEELGTIDVLIANAGLNLEGDDGYKKTGVVKPELWWEVMETNIRGPYLHVYEFLQQFLAVGKEPTGTIMIIASAAGSLTIPGGSGYSMSKLANVKQAEFLHAEHPGVRSFSVHPGLVDTNMGQDKYTQHMYIDPPELTGAYSLYLSTPRADFLRGRFSSVNWDVDELEKHKQEIEDKGLLKTAFIKAEFRPEGHPFEV
ncbi:hypothetical protein B0J11DRAFT_441630 [Dendryphion nanum]|uniref:NAD(P)-binding protein n=1 Tax=Dendryphion nanum TaxID=256645 RepID=A0A9P9DEM8_9PLEO|nr:hypothetical protein B0J11DRAFT_441630 [Dendryphion nanum]